MNTSASSTSFSTGSKNSTKSNVQVMLPLDKDQECQESTNVKLVATTSSTLTGEFTDLQTVEQAKITSMRSLPETRAHLIMKTIMSEGLYRVSVELLEADWTLEMMKQHKASIMEGTAIKFNKEWWSNISLRMLAEELSESELQEELILKSAAITKECVRLDLMTPRKEVPAHRQQGEKKDATSSDDDKQTPKGGTVRRQRNANGDPIEEQGGGMKAKKLDLPPSTPANKDANAAKKAAGAGAGADQAGPTPVEQLLHNNNETPSKTIETMPPPLPRTAPTTAAPTSPTP